MKIKISKCSNPLYWYCNKINYIFDVKSDNNGNYYVEEGALQYIILFNDAINLDTRRKKLDSL